MSRQNKVNPGTYTQRGRLTQDDAARELRKQRAIEPPRAWPPPNASMRRRLEPAGDVARDTERSAGNQTMVERPPRVETRPAASAKAAKAKPASTRKTKRTAGKAKPGKGTRPTRKAVRARSVGGRRTASRPATKPRKR
jgi:hypothetical protein